VWDYVAQKVNKYCMPPNPPPVPIYPTGPNCKTCGENGTNPINTGWYGNKHQRETDYVGEGPFPLRFERFYNSWQQAIPGLDPNNLQAGAWRHSYSRTIAQTTLKNSETDTNPQSIAVAYRPDGRAFIFDKSGTNWVSSLPEVTERLTQLADGSWQFISNDDEIEAYDTKGRLVTITNRAGLKLTLTYTASGITVSDSFARSMIIDLSGNAVIKLTTPKGEIYTYSGITSVTYPDTTMRTYEYTGNNALTGVVDAYGVRIAAWAYDGFGRAISSEHAGGTDRYTITYSGAVNEPGSPVTITDPQGTTRTYNYNGTNDQTRGKIFKQASASQPCATCPGGGIASTTYDANGFVASKTDFKGNVTNYSYDARGLEQSRTEAAGTAQARTITTAWHATFRLPTKITETGRVTDFVYDAAKGTLLTKTITDSTTLKKRIWTYTYNTNGQVVTVDAPRTDAIDTATYTYDAQGNVATYTNALSQKTLYTSYDANGKLLSMTDPNGLVTTLTYDVRGHLKTRKVGAELTQYDYDNVGQLIKITQPDSSFISYTYDAAHRLTDMQDSFGNKIHYTLDFMGNRTKEEVSDPLGVLKQSRSRLFDTLNRLQKDIGGTNLTTQITQYGYDTNGNLTSTTDPLTRTTGNAYDALNRLSQITDPNNGTVKYAYDGLDHLIQVTDPRNLVTNYGVDNLDNNNQTTSPDTAGTTRTYDDAGNLKTSTDARGQTTTYTYDALNRVTAMAFTTGTGVTFQYDTGTNALGRLNKITDESGSTSWTYNAQGRVASKAQVVGTLNKSISYVYDAAGRVSSITYPSGKIIGYGYTNNRVSSITVNGAALISNIQYQPFGPAKSWTWSNGGLYSRSFDADGRVKTYSLGTSTKTITYDDAGRITGIADSLAPTSSQSFGYDNLDRLVSFTQSTTSLGYSYDASGNRTAYRAGTTNYPYTVAAASNKLTALSGPTAQTNVYDLAGNLTSDGSVTYTYNARGRLSTAKKGTTTTTYLVNGLGQRAKKTVGSTVTLYHYDEGGKLLGEYNSAGTAQYETIYLDDQPVAVIKPGSTATTYKAYYVYADHLNTPRLITDNATGTANKKAWQWDSDPFGASVPNENPAGAGTFTYNQRFPGQVYDKETGLHYNYFRDYNPATGRYVQSDPIGLGGGINTYGYVGGNPLSYTDPKGLNAGIVVVGGVVVAAGLVMMSALPKPRPDLGAANDPTFGDKECPPDCTAWRMALNRTFQALVASDEVALIPGQNILTWAWFWIQVRQYEKQCGPYQPPPSIHEIYGR
jgi:RHS repeat-associated protein